MRLLELPETATVEEIKRAYRRLVSQNHPDKLAVKGLPESMRAIAEERTRPLVWRPGADPSVAELVGDPTLVRDFLSGVFMILEDQYGVGDAVDLGED